ncbi:hypothetical protein Cri9333_4471 [Crinalium epipsammum PCC 9333]|uniref:Nicotinate phosphoribosyltransferase n=1 Tax=Crinalium epipsammum PCC 9333 TaxID=1173022 RepID=K9W4G9_9CYAN|nr:hypothetical protein [Crinalium epipsammum]AFZ15253.1 hypothetical protein Cri9333_4471 [Crinalium epipsammum PCC 9333]
MGITRWLESITQYLSKSVVRIFSPTDDAYPTIGVQPFEGERYKARHDTDW